MGGGLERNILYLANYMAKKGYDVHLITFDRAGAKAFYEIDPSITWHKIGVTAPHSGVTFKQRLGLLKDMRSIIKGCGSNTPIICFHHGILVRFILANLLLGNPVICSERNSLSIYKYVNLPKHNLNYFMMFLVRAITVQFPAYVKNYHPLLQKRITPIGNPVFPAEGCANVVAANDKGRFSLLTVTRLCGQKNLEELIKAFASIADQFSDWDLDIVGDGEWQERLAKLIQSLDMSDRIFLRGKQKNVSDFYKSSHLFCLPSQWEGFPNALAEALSYGLPAVGYEETDGVNQLITHGKNGLLAKDQGNIDTLSAALSALMLSPETREKMSVQAVKSIAQYKPTTVFAKWDMLIAGVLK